MTISIFISISISIIISISISIIIDSEVVRYAGVRSRS